MAKDKTTTIVQAGAKGGVSAVMPYVAIGVLGYLGLKQLKNLDIGVGGVAGSIIDSVSDAADNVTTYITDKAGDTVLFITEGVEDVGDTAKEFIPAGIGEYEDKRPLYVAAEEMKLPKSTKVFQALSTYEVGGYRGVSKIGVTAPKGTYKDKIVIAPGEAERVRSTYGTVQRSGVKTPTKTPTVGPVTWTPPTKEEMAKKPTKEWTVVK